MNTALKDAITKELMAARTIADAAEKAVRDFTVEERNAVDGHMKRVAELTKAGRDQDDLRKQMGDLSDGLGMNADDDTDGTKGGDYTPVRKDTRADNASLGTAFTDSPEYKALLATAPNGIFSEKSRVQSAPFGVKTLLTGTDRTTSAGALLTPQRLGLLDAFYQRPLTIRDLVSHGVTGTDTIEYVQLVSVTNNAAPVAEATTTAGATAPGTAGALVLPAGSGVKPESGMVFAKQTTNVRTIAHWMPATKRALSDAGQIRTLIDSFLLYGLEEELEDQIVSGDGTGENLLGLASVPNTQAQVVAGTDDAFDITRKARTKVRIGGRSIPTAYVMHPTDWEKIELKRTASEKVFYGAGPYAMTTPHLWGLPVVESEALTVGTAWLGDWTKAVLWDREQASIQATDSHADFFVRNLVAILAEFRCAFGVLRPSAFVKITMPA